MLPRPLLFKVQKLIGWGGDRVSRWPRGASLTGVEVVYRQCRVVCVLLLVGRVGVRIVRTVVPAFYRHCVFTFILRTALHKGRGTD